MSCLPQLSAVVDLFNEVQILDKFAIKINRRKVGDLSDTLASSSIKLVWYFNSEIARPIVAPKVVIPAILSRITVAYCSFIVDHRVVRKCEKFVIRNHNLESLVVDECPKALVAKFVHGYVRIGELYFELCLHGET